MTIGYGGTPFGFADQIWTDTRDLSPYLHKQEKLWTVRLGALIHETCRSELGTAGQLLNIFESIAEKYNEQEKAVEWVTPVTGFIVKQDYRQPITNRTWLQYGEMRINVVVESWDETKLDKHSQKLGLSPNLVHSLDAAHMSMTVNACDFPVVPIHDSWGCTAGNMTALFQNVRREFVNLYATDPLKNILTQLECTELMPTYGSLDLNEVEGSDFAFC